MQLRWRGAATRRAFTTEDFASLGFEGVAPFTVDRSVDGGDVINVSEELAAKLREMEPGWYTEDEEVPDIVEAATSHSSFAPEEDATPVEYEDMSVADLKKLIKARNAEQDDEELHMLVSGTKDELVTRLRDNDAANADEGDQQEQ